MDVDHHSGVFSSDCIRPAPEMADVFLGSVKSHLCSFSGGDCHRACYALCAPVFVTESVPNTYPRAKEPGFEAAKQKELLGLLKRATFEIVLREDIPPNATVLKGPFFLVVKHKDPKGELFKARYVVQGFADPLMKQAVHNSPNLRQDISRLILAMASVLGYETRILDISMAFLLATSTT
jgi:hypothetical protein